jgi:hypothetical protein
VIGGFVGTVCLLLVSDAYGSVLLPLHSLPDLHLFIYSIIIVEPFTAFFGLVVGCSRGTILLLLFGDSFLQKGRRFLLGLLPHVS